MDVSAPQYIGHSHLALFVQRAAQHGLTLDALDLRKMKLTDKKTGKLVRDISNAVAGRDVISFIGGNAHNIFGLLRHPIAYDFEMPGDDAPLDHNAQAIPYSLMREAMATHRHTATYLDALALIVPLAARVIQVESPPPIKDESQIFAHPNRHFVDSDLAEIGVAPALLRRKLWRLHSSVVAERCAALGIAFMRAPEAAIDDGFLRPKFFRDATHANGAYADLVRRQIEAL